MSTTLLPVAPPPFGEDALFPDDAASLEQLVFLQRVLKAVSQKKKLRSERDVQLTAFLQAEQQAFECLSDDSDGIDDQELHESTNDTASSLDQAGEEADRYGETIGDTEKTSLRTDEFLPAPTAAAAAEALQEAEAEEAAVADMSHAEPLADSVGNGQPEEVAYIRLTAVPPRDEEEETRKQILTAEEDERGALSCEERVHSLCVPGLCDLLAAQRFVPYLAEEEEYRAAIMRNEAATARQLHEQHMYIEILRERERVEQDRIRRLRPEDYTAFLEEDVILFEQDARSLLQQEEADERAAMVDEMRWLEHLHEEHGSPLELLQEEESITRLQHHDRWVASWEAILNAHFQQVLRIAHAFQRVETVACLAESETKNRAVVEQLQARERDYLIEDFFLNRVILVESEYPEDPSESSHSQPTTFCSARRQDSFRTVNALPVGASPPVFQYTPVAVCPPHANGDVTANPFLLDSPESLAHCEGVFRDLLFSMERNARGALEAHSFFASMLRLLLHEEEERRSALERDADAQHTFFEVQATLLRDLERARMPAERAPERVEDSAEHVPPLSASASRRSSRSLDCATDASPDRLLPTSTTTSAVQEGSFISGILEYESNLVLPFAHDRRRVSRVVITPPNALPHEQPFVAFSLASVEEFEETCRDHLVDQHLSSVMWLRKDFFETMEYILCKHEARNRDRISYDASLAWEQLTLEEAHHSQALTRALELRRQTLFTTPLILTPEMAAKLEKLTQREKAARNKIITAEKSFLRAFHDEFAADLRRTNSFSMANLKLSTATLSSSVMGSPASHLSGDAASVQKVTPDSLLLSENKDTCKKAEPAHSPGRKSTRERTLQKVDSFRRATSASFSRRTERKALFTDQLHTPRELELNVTPPMHFLGYPAAITPNSAVDGQARSQPDTNSEEEGAPKLDGYGAVDQENSFSIDQDEILGSGTRRPHTERELAGANASRDTDPPSPSNREKPHLHLSPQSLTQIRPTEKRATGETQGDRAHQNYFPMPMGPEPILSPSSATHSTPQDCSTPSPALAKSAPFHEVPSSSPSCTGVPGFPRKEAHMATNPPDPYTGMGVAAPTPVVSGDIPPEADDAAATMTELLYKKYHLQTGKHYRMRLRDFVDVVLVVGATATMDDFSPSPRKSSSVPDPSQKQSVAMTPRQTWTHPVLFEKVERYLADKRHSVDGALLEETEHMAGAWVYVEDVCAALVHGLGCVYRQLTGASSAQKVPTPSSASRGQQVELHSTAPRTLPSGGADGSLPVAEWTMQLITYGLDRLVREQGLPNRDIAASVFDLLASANVDERSRRSPSEVGDKITGTGEEGFCLTTGRTLSFPLFKNVFLSQVSASKTLLGALRMRTNIDFSGSGMSRNGVPYLAFSAFLYNTGTKRKTFSLTQLRRTIEPLLQPNQAQLLLSPSQGKPGQKGTLPRPQLSPQQPANIKMLFVHRGADVVSTVVASHGNLSRLQHQCRSAVRPLIQQLVAASLQRDVDKPKDCRGDCGDAGGGADVSLSLGVSNGMHSTPSDGVSFTTPTAGAIPVSPQDRETAPARSGSRKAFMQSVRAYFFGILDQATDDHKYKLASKCLLLLVLFSTWMEQDEEALAALHAAKTGTSQATASPGVKARAPPTDRFWTRRVFQVAAEYYSFLGKVVETEGKKDSRVQASASRANSPQANLHHHGGDPLERSSRENSRKKTLSPSDLDTSLADAEDSNAAALSQGLTLMVTRIAVLFYDFLLNLRGHRRSNFPAYMKVKPLPTSDAVEDLQKEIRYYYKRREVRGDRAAVAPPQTGAADRKMSPESTTTSVATVNGKNEGVPQNESHPFSANSSCYAGFLDDTDAPDSLKWIRTPVDAHVVYTEYPEGSESLRRVTEVVGQCLNVAWLGYSPELDGVVTYYSRDALEETPALDLNVFCKSEEDTADMERMLEEAALHADNFNRLLDAAMIHLQALWSGSRWLRTVASASFRNPNFAVPTAAFVTGKSKADGARSPVAQIHGSKDRNQKTFYPETFEECSKQLAECIISAWPYKRKERTPFHHIPAAVYRRKYREGTKRRAQATTQPSTRAPRPGFVRRASLASFASSIRSFNASVSTSPSHSATGHQSCNSSLTERSFNSMFGDIVFPTADFSITGFESSTASFAMIAGGSRSVDPFQSEMQTPESRRVQGRKCPSPRTPTAAARSSPEALRDVSHSRRRRSSDGGQVIDFGLGAVGDVDCATPRRDNRGREVGPAHASPPQPATHHVPHTSSLAPAAHTLHPSPNQENEPRRRRPKSPDSPELMRRAFSSSRLLCVAPEPEVRECIDMSSVSAASALASRRATMEAVLCSPQLSGDTEGAVVARGGQVSEEAPVHAQPVEPVATRSGRVGRRLKAKLAPPPNSALSIENRQQQLSTSQGTRAGGAGTQKAGPRKPLVARHIQDTYNDLSTAPQHRNDGDPFNAVDIAF